MRALLLALALCAAPAVARADAGLELGIAAVHEAGLSVQPEEVAALHAVIIARCHGDARCQMRRLFSGRTSRPWVLWLRRDGSRPWGWPAGPSWTRFAPRWLEVLAAADAVVAGERAHACDAAPMFWGMRHGIDAERASRAGWLEVDCGSTRNAFWRRP